MLAAGTLAGAAARGRRVLIIGLGDSITRVTQMLLSNGAFQLATVTSHGLVQVIVLEQKGP